MTDLHPKGNSLQIIAGPGTGKTTELVKQIASALGQMNDSATAVVACTFTRRASDELIHRIEEIVGSNAVNSGRLLIGTIHSVSLGLLREFLPGEYSDWDVLSEESQVPYVHSKLSMFGFSEPETRGQQSWDLAKEISRIYATITDESLDIDNLVSRIEHRDDLDAGTQDRLQHVLDNYPLYRLALADDKLFDYASIQQTLCSILHSDLRLARLVVKRYPLVFVDEYQDVNDVQNAIFTRLCQVGATLTVVGDDDQSIYGFRGSNVDHLIKFADRFVQLGVDVQQMHLNVNYRSTPQIVCAASAYANAQSFPRLQKDLVAHRSVNGPDVRILQFESDEAEAKWIVDEIVGLRESGTITSFRSVGILFTSVRNHAAPLMTELVARGVPARAIGAGTLLNQDFATEFIGILDYWLNRDMDPAGRESRLLETLPERVRSEYQESEILGRVRQLVDAKPFYGSCLALMYDLFTATDFVSRHEYHGSNIGTITSLVHSFDTFAKRFNPYGLYSYLISLSRQADLDYVNSEQQDAVQVVTIHRSKGLEFDVVFVGSQQARKEPRRSLFDHFSDLADRPHRNSDESSRLLYVAMTRARNFAAITSSISSQGKKRRYDWTPAVTGALRSGIGTSSLPVDHLARDQFTDFSALDGSKPDLSYNSIRLYEICPLQYRFAHVDRLETVRIGGMQFGVNMHRLLEQLIRRHKSGFPTSSDDIDILIERYWRDLPTRSNDENVKFRSVGRDQLELFVAEFLDDLTPEQIGGIEEPFSLAIADSRITGRIDLRLARQGRCEIVDFKTGDRNDYTSQLHFYAACWGQMTGEIVSKVGIYFLKTGELDLFEPESADVQIARVSEIASRIKTREFTATPGTHCGDCPYSAICEFSQSKKKSRR